MKNFSSLEVPWRPLDALVVFVLAWIGAPIAIVYFVKLSAPYIPLLANFLAALRNGGITASFIFAVINGIASLAVIGFYVRKYSAHWRDVGWRRFNILKAVLYIALAIALFIVAIEVVFVVLTYVFPNFNANQVQANEFTNPRTSTARTLSLIALVVLPPIIEETVFRGFIFSALSKLSKWRGAVVGAVLTSLLFGLAHLQYNVGVYTIILSLILCAMYYRFRSIWPGVVLHMINNYIAYMTLMKNQA